MKKIVQRVIPVLLLLSAQTINALTLFGRTFFSPRSQSVNSARRLFGQHPYMHNNLFNGTFSATAEYTRSYRTRRIADYFFGTDVLPFTGSLVTDREEGDILADYFGLSPAYEGTMKLYPEAHTFVMDFNLYWDLNKWCPGLYTWISAPVTWARYQICLEDTIFNDGSSIQYPAEYMDTDALTAPARSPKRYFEGDLTYGQVKEGIRFGKMGCQIRRGMADVRFAVGYDCIRRERGHVGFNLQAAAPTGSKPTGQYMFEPVIGNGDHWEFGFGFTGALLLWEEGIDHKIVFNVDTNFTHLFKSCQHRSFDLVEKFGSRFILLKEFDATGEYADTVIPAINVTTLKCKVWSDLQIDLTFMASYIGRNWIIDGGYNGWIRSREKICLVGAIEKNKYGLKGIQNVAGIDKNNTQTITATLHGNTLDPVIQQEVADNPSPQFIETPDLDLCSAAAPLSITHKFFFCATYAWNCPDDQKTVPYLGAGFEVEFEGIRHNEAQPFKETMSQYGVWVKGGLAF